MSVQIIQADARQLPLADDSVDLIVTSPPYFGLRSYTDGGEHYDGQIGAEATPADYIDALIECTREWMRVLKPEGNLWVNLGDSYYSGKGSPGRATVDAKNVARTDRRERRSPLDYGLPYPRKTLLGIPWRYALRCLDDLGLIIRAEVIWSKANAMPESITDRVRRSHETWFHLTMDPTYFAALDEIREAPSGYARPNGSGREPRGGQKPRKMLDVCNPVGRIPGSVWEVPTQPLRVPDEIGTDHYAAFPLEWPLRIIRGWSPSGICTECGEGRRPVSQPAHLSPEGERLAARRNSKNTYSAAARGGDTGISHHQNLSGTERARHMRPATITGYACACPEPDAPTRPAVVLDPFGGTGTTALAADVLDRAGISVDMSADYCKIARWRTTNPGERARAMGVPKPEPVPAGQTTLFEMESS